MLSVCSFIVCHPSSEIIESNINTCGMPKRACILSIHIQISIHHRLTWQRLCQDLQTFQYLIIFNHHLIQMNGRIRFQCITFCFLLVKALNFNLMIDFCSFVFSFLCVRWWIGTSDEKLALRFTFAMHEWH